MTAASIRRTANDTAPTPSGRHILRARGLLEAGVRFVKVNSYHWDTHGDNFNMSQRLVPQIDRPFAALINDLDERGMLENVIVIVMSEFGRTPVINSRLGRDHWPDCWSLALAGCGIRRGVVLGNTTADGAFVEGISYDVGEPLPHHLQSPGHRPAPHQVPSQGTEAVHRPRRMHAHRGGDVVKAPPLDVRSAWVSRELTHDRQLFRAQFSPDGQFIAAGGQDKLVHLWDLAAEEPKHTTLAAHRTWISSLAFHPDGARLYTARLSRSDPLLGHCPGRRQTPLDDRARRRGQTSVPSPSLPTVVIS